MRFMSYSSYDHDKLETAETMRIERRIYFESEKSDISGFAVLPMAELLKMREESAAAEQEVFDRLKEQAAAWEEQAGKTLSLDKALEYARTLPVKHTSNQWEQPDDYRHIRSNAVYQMSYSISENTRYDSTEQKSIPYSWTLRWSIYTNAPGAYGQAKIAGQERKVFGSREELDKYLNGRIKAHQHLFTEISPAIPREYADHFKVNGLLLPGYTVEGEPPRQSPEHSTQAEEVKPAGPEQPQEHYPSERSERMSAVFSIQLHNRRLFEQDKPGVWLDLPTTAEKLQEAMRQVEITTDNPQDFFINGYSCPEDKHLALPYDMVLAADVDELNFLAARLEALDAAGLAELNAALQNPQGDFRSIGQISDYPDNLDYYVHLPDVQNTAQLGDYYLNRSGMVDMPEEWKAGIDTARLGRHIAQQEQGAFTPYGYLVKSGDEWQQVHEGQPVPEAYRVMAYPPPEVLREESKTLPEQGAAPAVQAPPPVVPIIFSSENSGERMKEITDRLETGIQALFESDRYKAYLTTMSKFHSYSFNNTLLIAMQGGQLVAGYNKWRDDFHRNVKKGEKAIKILAPAPFKAKKEVQKLDAQGRPVMGKDGKPVTEVQEIQVPAFKIVSVFDVSQTEGEPLPSIGVEELTGSVERYGEFFKALEQTSPVPIGFEDIPGGSHGYYHLTEKRIAIQEGMSELQTLKTAIHEIAHSKLHAIDPEAPAIEQADRPDSRTREVQAESVAYAVCQHYGLDTSDYSFGYVAGWSSGKDLKELKASLETIRATAHELIETIDGHLAQLQQERQAQQAQPEAAPLEQVAEQPNPDSVFSKLPPEQQAAMTEEVRAMLQTLIDTDLKTTGQVSQGTKEAIQTQGFTLTDAGTLERAEAPEQTPALDPAAEPVVTVIWSESPDLRDGEQMPLSRADAIFKALDAARQGPGYDKTKFRIDCTFQGEPDSYEGRQDFGDGEGGLIEHIQGYHEYYARDEQWKNFVLHNKGPEALAEDEAQRQMLLTEFVPYLKQHCALSQLEQAARQQLQSGDPLPPEMTAYLGAVTDYVKECRLLLNQGQYQLPELPKLSDFDHSLQEYKEQVQAEIAQEAESYGMTVEEYAANGFEPYDTAPVQEAHADAEALTDLQKQAVQIADRYKNLPLKEKIGIIAQTFGCQTGEIHTSPCTGKWRGTSDISIRFDNGASLFIGNHLTPKAKTVKVQTEYVDSALTQYNPEIIRAAKEAAMPALRKREARDNEIAAQKGVKPYTVLNVEFNDGSDEKNGGYMGWYYVTLAVDGKICTHMETGLHYDIANGKVSDIPSARPYYAAGALKETDVDYVFNNVGFSSASSLYSLPVRADVLERAEAALAEREKAQITAETPVPEQPSFSIYQLRHGEETRDYRFEPYDRLQAAGLTVDRANYDLVYTAPLTEGTTLEDIYRTFNIDHPKGFTGHSLSISDVVVLQRDGVQEAHYCDRFGFTQVPKFLQPQQALTPNAHLTGETVQTPRGSFRLTAMSVEQMQAAGYGLHHTSDDGKYHIMGNGTLAFAVAVQPESPIKAAELSTEQNTNMIDGVLNNAPTMEELEARAKAGEQISLLDVVDAAKAEAKQPRQPSKPSRKQEKPSIRAQLRKSKEQAATAPKKEQAQKKDKEMEV